MQKGRGHRMNMMKAEAREIGLSALSHSSKIRITHNFGRGKGMRFVDGVVKISTEDGKNETVTWKSGA